MNACTHIETTSIRTYMQHTPILIQIEERWRWKARFESATHLVKNRHVRYSVCACASVCHVIIYNCVWYADVYGDVELRVYV